MELIKEIGAIAGIGAFFGLAVLSLLYFSQARDVRRLREWAGRAPEREAEGVEATSDLAAERAEELRKVEEERRQREEAAAAEQKDAAEDRDVRRQRREAGLPERTRMERLRDLLGGGLESGRFGTGTIAAAVIVGVVVIGGVVLAVTQLGGGSDSTSSAAPGKSASVKPGQITVAVLNGTNPPVNGLAGIYSDKLQSKHFQTGKVGNSSNSFTVSEVMFKRGHKPEAEMVANSLKIPKVRLMTTDIVNDIAGESVAVVVGQDKANAGG